MHPSRIAALCTSLLLAACSDEARESAAPAAPKAAAPAPATTKAVTPAPPSPTAPSKAEPCDEVTPHFAFDSAEPILAAPGDLRELAQCLNERLEGDEAITLVGRTDARGTEAYNRALARRRAERVRSLLTAYGLSADRIHVQSAGERDALDAASGHASWKERRVDIVRSDQRITRN